MNAMNAEPVQLLRVKEAAAQLRLSRATVYELMRTRQVSYVQIGRTRLIPAAAVAELIRRGTVEGAVP